MISATLFFRPDDTVSGVTVVESVTYTASNGKEVTTNDTREGSLEELSAVLGKGYADNEARHAALEQQISDERAAAKADKDAALAEAEANRTADLTRVQAEADNRLMDFDKGAKAALAEKDEQLRQRDVLIQAVQTRHGEVAKTLQEVAARITQPIVVDLAKPSGTPPADATVADSKDI